MCILLVCVMYLDFCFFILILIAYVFFLVFFFNYTATTEIYTSGPPLSLHDALPIWCCVPKVAPCTSRANFVSGIGCMDLRLVPSVLRGRFIQLEPYHEDLQEEVRAALNCDPEGWELLSISGQGGNFEAWWSSITAHVATGHWMAYAVRDLDSGTVVGTSSFLNITRKRC